ncbi:polyketide synthase [Penicillium verhagenii]|uniref:polyketide synthase n=1 Tax=Penicillium verhagenii TaxID=1562060 RepID=UPI00254584D4|nr:polyketide synthase [Penicillium verhagenii]KAJ5928129.1 polyketide synthase [Penicillium verhagenii]
MKLILFVEPPAVHEYSIICKKLRIRSKSSDDHILRWYLSESTRVLREEFRRLSAELKTDLPPFQSELRESHSRIQDPQGQFTPTLADLPTVGAEAIRIAFRTGIVMQQRARQLEPQTTSTALNSWTLNAQGASEDTIRDEVQDFNAYLGLPDSHPSRIFLSAIHGVDNVMISGSPSKLGRLMQCGPLKDASHAPALHMHWGPSHAPHLFDQSHVLWVVKESKETLRGHDDLLNVANIISPSDGEFMASRTVFELFQAAVNELLTKLTRWDKVAAALCESPALSDETQLIVEIVGTTHITVDNLIHEISAIYPGIRSTLHDLGKWIEEDKAFPGIGSKKIAIVGISCRFPGGANDPEKFWQLLEGGRDVHCKVPADRFDVDTHTDITGKRPNTSMSPFGCFIDQPGLFDAGFFDMSPREAGQTDPTHRLALVTAYEALEHAGYTHDRTPSSNKLRVGTFYGQCCDDYREANAEQNVDTYFIPGNYRAFAPGRISYFFKFSGPSFNCDTACSASLATIQIACTSLLHGDADMVVAGGVNILTNSDSFAGLSRGYFLSLTGGCKVFDSNADGYCRADGVGSVVLKRLADAQQDNDNILGIIVGSATNHSANAVSITHPHAATQANLFRQILTQSGVSPLDVDVVEMHGTGTQVGDVIEMESVTSVFSPPGVERTHPLYISSVKANVGHAEAAAGMAALIKVLLAFQHNEIPRHVGIKTALNPRFPALDDLNIRIPQTNTPWPRSSTRKRYAMVNNFSAAGGNTSLLLEEPPVRPDPKGWACTNFVVGVSAKNIFSLKGNLQNLIDHLESDPTIHLPSLSYTTTARRMHHPYRVAAEGATIQQITNSLRQQLQTNDSQRPVSKTPRSTALVFSGQGSHYVGVGRQLFENQPVFGDEIRRLDEICILHGFPSIVPSIATKTSDSIETDPVVINLLAVCIAMALCRLWSSLGVTPGMVIGASLGEYPALYAAGVLCASDIIFLVGQRAMLLKELCTPNTHAMLAVRATIDQIRNIAQDIPFEVACLNGHNNISIAGTADSISKVQLALTSCGYRSTKLNVEYAFHSSQIEPILDRFEKVAQAVTFKEPQVPVLSPSLASCISDGNTFDSHYLRNMTRLPVQFVNVLEKAQELGAIDSNTIWIEIGAHPTYSNSVRAAFEKPPLIFPSLRQEEDNWHTFAKGMAELYHAGVELNWNSWYQPFETELRLLNLPAYHWKNKNHWIQYNGDWMLVKDKGSRSPQATGIMHEPSLRTTLIHQLVEESILDDRGTVTVRSNIVDSDFFRVASGHKMNGRPVVSVFAYTDMALTLANYLHTNIRPGAPLPAMDFSNVQILKGLMPHEHQTGTQIVQVKASADLKRGVIDMSWYHLLSENNQELVATGVVQLENSQVWMKEWADLTHLLTSRIDILNKMANKGQASRLSRDLIYTLFQTLVEYSKPYHGMQSVVLNGMEATAEVILSPPSDGKWTVCPQFIDPIAHIRGFALNCGNAADNRNNIFVMDSWQSMRFARPLTPGIKYQTYVKMQPVPESTTLCKGDVYVLEANEVIGVIGRMTLRSYPRVLLGRFFPRDGLKSLVSAGVGLHRCVVSSEDEMTVSTPPTDLSTVTPSPVERECSSNLPGPRKGFSVGNQGQVTESVVVAQAMALIASETGMDLEDMTDETSLSSMGVDSLLSLVLVEKFATELNIVLQSHVFLECPTVRDFKISLAALSGRFG